MNLRQAENVLFRYLASGRPTHQAPRTVRRALDIVERHEQAREGGVPRDQLAAAIDVYDELKNKGEAYRRRAQAREQLADYIVRTVLPTGFDTRLSIAADKLAAARRTGTYGRRPDGRLVTIWDDKAGLPRLCPDDAREESQRLAERYGAHVCTLAKKGRGLHYLVLTIPNVDQGELAAAQREIFSRWIAFNRLQAKRSKAFPEILGSLAICESPLAADGTWNVHLNVLLVTRRRFHDGLYERVRRAWGFNAEMRPVKGDAGEVARAFAELAKYAARAIPDKSADKRRRHATDAPAMTEWPPAAFREWYDAQHGFRRTRTYGCLYGSNVPKPEPEGLAGVVWLGGLWLSGDRLRIAAPIIDLIPGDKSATGEGANCAQAPP